MENNSSAEKFREARHGLNLGVNNAFRKASIVIDFPQRDIHSAASAITPMDLVGPDSRVEIADWVVQRDRKYRPQAM